MRVVADQHRDLGRAEHAVGIDIPARIEQHLGARRRQAHRIGNGRPGDEADPEVPEGGAVYVFALP